MMTMVQWLIYIWADMAWTFVSTISIPACLVGGSAGILARRQIGMSDKATQVNAAQRPKAKAA
jgi:hypothetical protein